MGTKYRHLMKEERDIIAVLKAEGLSHSEIARRIGRDKSTISRELNRNAPVVYKGYYLSHKADERARNRWVETHNRERLKNQEIRSYVETKLKQGWSPEIIAGRLPIDRPGESISHEAIYQYIYEERKDFVCYLVRRHKKRTKRGYSRKHRKSHIPNRIPISQRPDIVEKRGRLGDWEVDSVVSRQSKVALSVLAERFCRLVRITKMNQKTAFHTNRTIKNILGEYPQQVRKTITYDNGSENTRHEDANKSLGTTSYFCNAYHSWEKGTVENRIGLIRRWLPKKTDFSKISGTEIKHLENWINNRPMKCLNYNTPLEAFYERLSSILHPIAVENCRGYDYLKNQIGMRRISDWRKMIKVEKEKC